jgi:hypothetical protein
MQLDARRVGPSSVTLKYRADFPQKNCSIELKHVTRSIPTRYPPKDGGIWGVEVPPSGRDLGWEKKVPHRD